MSSRALRRLKGEQRAQAALQELELSDEERMKSDKHKLKNNISNIFELVTLNMTPNTTSTVCHTVYTMVFTRSLKENSLIPTKRSKKHSNVLC